MIHHEEHEVHEADLRALRGLRGDKNLVRKQVSTGLYYSRLPLPPRILVPRLCVGNTLAAWLCLAHSGLTIRRPEAIVRLS
jgi:hypothetical protein